MLLPRLLLSGWRVLACLAVVITSARAAPAAAAGPRLASSAEAITSIAAAFARWPELTDDNQPVRLEGVVTGTMPNGAFRMHDGNLGIYATRFPDQPRLTPGDRIIVQGVLRQAGFSPWITPHSVEVVGRGPFPQAQPVSFGVLAAGSADNQWVEIEGVVRSVELPEPRDFAVLSLGMMGGNLRVLVNYDTQSDFTGLIDAVVRIHGVAAVNINKHGHVVEPSFRVPSFAEIRILEPALADPFTRTIVPVARLMQASPGGWLGHRVRTGGVVTRQLSDTALFVRDGSRGLKIETSHSVRFKPGDVIEAAGFPVMEDGMAVLEEAVCRQVSSGAPPAPVLPTIADLLAGSHNSDLVKIRARLVDWVAAGQNITLVFQAGNQLFKGLVTTGEGRRPDLPAKESLVEVSGICVISELEDMWFYQPRSFLVLVAGVGDLRVLQAPPWWTLHRLWGALAITGLVLLAAAGWAWSLRRQVERKRAVIEQQTRHAAALEERSRIARELHDTLEQGLTGLSLQMKALEADLPGTAPVARERLQFARQMLRQSRALARNAIREIRSETSSARHEGLVEGLRRVADAWIHSGVLTADVTIGGNARDLPPRVQTHLLGIGTEAMTNAVKHGRADRLQVTLQFRATSVVLRISDNGAGFDPAAHLARASGCFGLLGMRERVRELAGEFVIHSRPGAGTEIVVTAPLSEAPAPARAPAPLLAQPVRSMS